MPTFKDLLKPADEAVIQEVVKINELENTLIFLKRNFDLIGLHDHPYIEFIRESGFKSGDNLEELYKSVAQRIVESGEINNNIF